MGQQLITSLRHLDNINESCLIESDIAFFTNNEHIWNNENRRVHPRTLRRRYFVDGARRVFRVGGGGEPSG